MTEHQKDQIKRQKENEQLALLFSLLACCLALIYLDCCTIHPNNGRYMDDAVVEDAR